MRRWNYARTRLTVLGLFARYSIHVWLLLILVNVSLYTVLRFRIMAESCMTPAQVQQTTNRCLYIYQTSIYEKGTPSEPHEGHACGSDVTSVMRDTHIADVAFYLDPNRIASVCASQPPTPTPVPPTPTSAPQPTSTPMPTQPPPPSNTPAPNQPTNTPAPIPTATAVPVRPTVTVAPTPTLMPTATIEPEPTVMVDDVEGNDDSDVSVVAVADGGEDKPPDDEGGLMQSMLAQLGKTSWWIRVTGTVGLVLLLASFLWGLYRVKLFGYWSRGVVMWLHYILGSVGGGLIVAHMLLLLADDRWGKVVGVVQLLWPSFRNATLISLSLGTFGFYLLVVVILSGIFFMRLARLLGYKAWSLTHMTSAVMILLGVAHAWRIGTDRRTGWYQALLLSIMLVCVWQINRWLWKFFHLPKPSLSLTREKINGLLGQSEPEQQIMNRYFVEYYDYDLESRRGWVQLSNGVIKQYGYVVDAVVLDKQWADVVGVMGLDHQVPYILIREVRQVS